MDKLLEALSKLLPEDQMKDITSAVEAMVENLENEYNKNLEEAYQELAKELQVSEQTGEEGYRQAWDIITDLRNRLETLRAEYDSALEEGYEEAYQAVLAEKGKNESVETELYEEYEKRFNESKEYMVNKLDQFLRTKGKEIYEQARRDIMNDPSMVEHKIVLEKIVEQVSDYIADEDRVLATSNKIDEANKAVKAANDRIKMLESRNVKLSMNNDKLNEQVKQAAELLSEATNATLTESKKARVEKAKNATGRGEVTTEKPVKVVAEYAANTDKKGDKNSDTTLVESISPEDLHSLQVLAGTKINN